jgi:nucleoside-diphosphate-sugar epimerase
MAVARGNCSVTSISAVKPTTVFVTGATGFAGGQLSRMLLARGQDVQVLVRDRSRAALLERAGARLVVGDVRQRNSFESVLPGVSVVYHLAAAFRAARLSDQEYFDVNLQGTVNVVEAAAGAGVGRVVHCSTVGVYGDTGRIPADETRSPAPEADSYNQSKFAGEQAAAEVFRSGRVPGVIVRPSAGIGPGETRYLKLFRGIQRGRFVMIGSGETLCNLAYVDDLCEGLILCGERPEAVGETFILGGEHNLTLNQLIEEVALVVQGSPPRLRVPLAPVMAAAVACEALFRPLGVEPPLHRRRVGFFRTNRAFDISKAATILGFAPRVPLRDALARTGDWYRSQGLL